MPRAVVLGATGSTNDDARAAASGGAPDGTVVVALAQRAGRGRLGRAWHSPPGAGAYVSIVFRPDEPAALLGRYGLAVAVAACEACREAAGEGIAIKWPNDLVSPGGKVGGILAELRTGPSGAELIVGVGINVNQAAGDFPADLSGRATSLRLLRRGAALDRDAFICRLVDTIGQRVAAMRREGWEAVSARFLRYAPHAAGARVRFGSGESGVTAGLDATGALRVDCGGAIRLAHAGESLEVVEG